MSEQVKGRVIPPENRINVLRRSDIYRLPSGTVIVVLDNPDKDRMGVNCMVIGGDHKVYQPGGYDIFVFFDTFTVSEKIELI